MCGLLIPVPRFFHIRANPHHAKLCKHVGVVRRAQRLRSFGVSGLRGSLKLEPRAGEIARRGILFALFCEKLDDVRSKGLNGLLRGLSASR